MPACNPQGAAGGSAAGAAAAGATAAAGGSASAASAAGPATFIVGTVLLRPDEPEPSRGRILVLEYLPGGAGGAAAGGGAVRLVTEKEVKGAAYNVRPFAGDKILASVNNKVRACGRRRACVHIWLACMSGCHLHVWHVTCMSGWLAGLVLRGKRGGMGRRPSAALRHTAGWRRGHPFV